MKNNYGYAQTVFVEGNTRAYLGDLEGYFRSSLSALVYGQTRNLRARTAVNSLLKNNLRTRVEDDDLLDEKIKTARDLIISQKINRTTLIEYLLGRVAAPSLDLINYAHSGIAVRIQQPAESQIRMRIFWDGNSNLRDLPLWAESFARHARNVGANPRIEARVEQEQGVSDNIPDIKDYVKTGKGYRSRQRIIRPLFKVVQTREGFRYEVQLTENERRMLRLFHPERKTSLSIMPSELCFENPLLSDYQGRGVIRNLFGILGMWDSERSGRTTYSYLHIPNKNIRAVRKAVVHGMFVKEVDKDSIAVLRYIFERTKELRSRYGNRFYPKFSRQEVSHKTGLEEDKVKEYMLHLEGILAELHLKRRTKWFIPKSRLELVREVLRMHETS